jgi:hypothetical protein
VSSFFKRLHAFSLAWAFLAAVCPVQAAKVCPVCGEELPDDKEVCPNDGTNLKLLEKYQPEKKQDGPKETEKKKKEKKKETDTGKSGEPGKRDEKTPAPAEPLLFKRHDQGGDRKPAATKESGGYSDRMSRIPGDKRHTGTIKRLPPAPAKEGRAASEAVDRKLKSDFESQRNERWQKDTSLRAARTQDKKGDERRRLLSSLAAPITSLGARILWLPEGPHPGPVGATEIDVNLARYRLRAGLSSLLGVRGVKIRNELIFIQTVTLGFQWPRRLSPFLVARGGVGLTATERFGEDQVYLMTALGAEGGMDAWISPWIAVSPSLGYMRCTVNNAYWHSFTAKVSVGF